MSDRSIQCIRDCVFLIAVLVAILYVHDADAQKTVVRQQTYANSGVVNYSAPAFVTKGNTTYQTLPNSTVRDYSKPTFVESKGVVIQTLPNSSVKDYNAVTLKEK